MNKQLAARQRIRKGMIILSLLLFPVIMNFFSPYIIIDGAAQGIVNGSLIVFGLQFLSALFVGRLWCGWACWTVMVLDLLPFKRGQGRLPGRWGWLRYVHFAFSLLLVAILSFGFDYPQAAAGMRAVYWYLAGNVLYYLTGIALAFALKDNRAFCKYLCPVSVPLKITSRFSLLKIKGDAQRCTDCRACEKMCPMDIRVPDYAKQDQRVLSTECSLCQTCITVCSNDALKLSFGLDLGGKDLLRERAR